MRLAVDTGALLATLDGTSDALVKLAERGAQLVMTPVNMAEVYYVLCRRLGEAAAIVKDLVESDVVHVVSPPGVHVEAARCKCRNSIALADCYSISLARRLGIKAVFNRERELEEAMGRDPQLARLIVFLDQLQH
jgi:predicted nucleic acid-binding protein